ncbi:MAG: cobalamin-independent methionine synthase II family protein [Solirubrobacterales bacterium]|nr:cobalamin-independent methionine synthase II family protein [Solirubrobacterales bacterium]
MSHTAPSAAGARATRARVPARSDQVGSLLRPRRLLEEVHRVYEPGHTTLYDAERDKDRTRLRELEDEAIREAVRRQQDVGLDVVTDGEFRRVLFTNSFYDAVVGLEPNPHPLVFVGDDGSEVRHPGPALVGGRLRKIDSPAAREAAFLKSITEQPFKVTFPAPSWFCFQSLRAPALQTGVYSSAEDVLADTIDILSDLARDAADAGAPTLQFDEPAYVFLLTPHINEFLESVGSSYDKLLETSLDTDRRLLASLPAGVTTAVHLCRGNYASRYMGAGPLDPLAEALFSLPVDRFLLEWEDEQREGDFSALRYVPSPGPIIVLGVLSSKDPRVETEDELLRRVEAATEHLPVEQLAISPQCGFASALGALESVDGNELDEDVQWRKFEVQARVVQRIWGA